MLKYSIWPNVHLTKMFLSEVLTSLSCHKHFGIPGICTGLKFGLKKFLHVKRFFKFFLLVSFFICISKQRKTCVYILISLI